MKKPETTLNWLFEAARTASPWHEAVSMPSYLKARILAHWRRGWAGPHAVPSLVLMFRQALMCATLVMLASIAWSLSTLAHSPENDVAIANFELRSDLMP